MDQSENLGSDIVIFMIRLMPSLKAMASIIQSQSDNLQIIILTLHKEYKIEILNFPPEIPIDP
jgi:hypothetical protein